MKAKTMFYTALVAILFTIFCVASPEAKMSIRKGPATPPVIVDVNSWSGGGLIVLYYPDEELVCFMNESGSGCIDIESLSPTNQKFIKKKAQAAVE